MRRRHRWTAVLPLLPLLLAGCGDDEPSGADPIPLKPYGDEVTLDDGTEARVAVRDDQEIVVQWRPEGAGWTEPETVYRETDHWIHDDLTLTTAGETLAINPDYWVEEVLEDDFPPDHSVQLICRDLSCTRGRRTTGDFLTNTRLTPDGEHALFRTDDTAAVLWNKDDGDQPVTLTGLGEDDDIALLDDGSLAAARTENVGEECLLVVHASEVSSGELTRVAEWGPYPGGPRFADGTVLCSLYQVEPDGAGVTVYLDEYDESGVSFRRDDESGWSVE